jgi:hypothetical protein
MTSPEIRKIVGDAYAHDLELPRSWDAGQRAAFLEAQAAIISYRVAEMAAELGAVAVGAWTRRHGAPPDYPTQVALINTARASAMDTVLMTNCTRLFPVPDHPPDDLPDV